MNTPVLPSIAFADAAQAAMPFLIGQGLNVETYVYSRRYRQFNYADTVPVVTEGSPWDLGTLFEKMDWAGEAKFISGAANDMPLNQVIREQAMSGYHMIGSGWEWNLEEVMTAMRQGRSLNPLKAAAATSSTERLLNQIAMVGSTEKNMQGFANSSLVTRVDAAATGSGSSKYFALKTVDNVIADINAALQLVRDQSLDIEYADSVRLPPAAFTDLATRRLGSGDGFITLLEYIRKNNQYTAETGQALDIQTKWELRNASVGGGGRMVVYRRDPEVLRFHLPMPRTVLPPYQKALMAWTQGLIARTGGTEWRLPAAAAYIDEITAPPA